MGGALLSVLVALITFGFIAILFTGPIMQKVYALIGALLFSVFLVYDIQVRAAWPRRAMYAAHHLSVIVPPPLC